VARSTRDYPSKPTPEGQSYLPSTGIGGVYGGLGMGFGAEDPVTRGPGKAQQKQHLGTVVGRRGAGISQIAGGDSGAHSMGHYGKKGIQGLIGGGG
jgi:hypothetical protein